MKNTKIEWAHHTFNPWIGCTKVSPGCVNCYAEARDRRFAGGMHWGNGAARQRTSEATWRAPVKWNSDAGFHYVCRCGRYYQKQRGSFDSKDAYAFLLHGKCYSCGTRIEAMKHCPKRPRVFCASLADWLDDDVPLDWLADLLELIHSTHNLDWLLLTKRPENWGHRIAYATAYLLAGKKAAGDWTKAWMSGTPPSNVWIGVTVENQPLAELRVPQLLNIPARVRFLSCEPLLGPVNIMGPLHHFGIHWVICGGESGPAARPMHPDWAVSLREQCLVTGVPFFFKQWGEWFPGYTDDGFILTADHGGDAVAGVIKNRKFPVQAFPPGDDGTYHEMARVGKKAAGRILSGLEWNQVPEVSR